jgi:hypothetical protein
VKNFTQDPGNHLRVCLTKIVCFLDDFGEFWPGTVSNMVRFESNGNKILELERNFVNNRFFWKGISHGTRVKHRVCLNKMLCFLTILVNFGREPGKTWYVLK